MPTTSSSSYTTDSSRWIAVQARDPSADGLFVYAVRTTKIYCRPVCKARRARRANISFFVCCRDAEQAGFRACKRCRPNIEGEMPEEAAVTRIRSLIEQRFWETILDPDKQVEYDEDKTDEMAQRVGVSKWHFHRIVKKITGMTPAEYVSHQRDLKLEFSTARI